ncbi:MAG: hypothetical protein F4X15_07225 [Gemmatimonadetes bacterium]|nr:hypothetical protein [Gemmatimonadota bacterium]MYC91250.1 hypothetical protein [Gemmatimonadota bacterium]
MERIHAGHNPDRIPWYLTAVLFASTSVIVGIIWDISWHRTIGRDSFWTPAHLAVYTGGLTAGLSCGWLALKTTFSGTDTEVGRSVRMWGFRAPLGAWVAIWGAIAMLTSAPLDDWWHNAYGLDVEILSPPHVVLAMGICAIQLGALLMALSWQNRASERGKRLLGFAYAYSAGLLLLTLAVLMLEYSFPNDWRGPVFHMISAGVYPVVFFAVGRAARLRWPATWTALVYMGMTLVMMWVLPLFPAEPLLAPILRNVDRMVAPEFPLVLIVPAIALDLLLRRASQPGRAPVRRSVDWGLAALGSVAFVGLFGVVHWYFGEFMLSEASRNYFFQGDTWGYNNAPGPWQYEFWNGSRFSRGEISFADFLSRAWWALPIGFVSARVGLWVGNWMLAVRR